MTRSLSHTITTLTECELAVEVTGCPAEDVTIALRDPHSGLEERRSFLPQQMDKAASWLHGTAVRVFPASRYAVKARSLEAALADEAPEADLHESLRQGLTGFG
jgi:hypothetical protein